MVERAVELGPGSIRVGRFIGRLGVVAMPAIERGSGLVDRVVRRHVAKLEAVGWCGRVPAIRGDGMLVWMTASGLDGVGLGELAALRAPEPFSLQTQRTIRVAWAAADIERAGHGWVASREMALAPERWAARVASERGGHGRRLPDLAFWPADDPMLRVAVDLVMGQSNPRRERAALEGWQAAIAAGQYAQVRYLAGPAAASRLRRLADRIGLTAPQFIADDHVITDEPLVLPVAREDVEEVSAAIETAPGATPDLPPPSPSPSPEHDAAQPSGTEEPAETPEQAAEHQKLIDEVPGRGEPVRRRRWRRGAV